MNLHYCDTGIGQAVSLRLSFYAMVFRVNAESRGFSTSRVRKFNATPWNHCIIEIFMLWQRLGATMAKVCRYFILGLEPGLSGAIMTNSLLEDFGGFMTNAELGKY
jgi:hypothetical protein